MKLKDYLERLNELVKNKPEALEMEVLTARDDEGNGFNVVHYAPSVQRTKDLGIVSALFAEKVVILN
jgi:hypothetical protein